MILIALRATLVALFLAAAGTILTDSARADDCWHRGINPCCDNSRTPPPCRPYADPYWGDLFYNYYSQGLCDRTAEMYPSPYPTPMIAGQTYITYQPLMPHEYMYKHHRSYHTYYDGGKGLNRTLVHYSYNPAKVALGRIYATISLPR
jgi:hypothetical protein